METSAVATEVQSKVLEWLHNKGYEVASLESLTGGQTNFIYHVRLSQSLEDGAVDIIVKHGEPYMARHPANKLTTHRCDAEAVCLKILSSLKPQSRHEAQGPFLVQTPKCYLYDEITNTQIHEYLPNSISLKDYAIKYFGSPTPQSLEQNCYNLGKELGEYVARFHRMTKKEINELATEGQDRPLQNLLPVLQANKEMQTLKHFINYDWLIERVNLFPEILSEAKDIFLQVKQQALEELEIGRQDLVAIHGDLSTFNVLLPNQAIEAGTIMPVSIVDWENAQLGVASLDHGEMLGEMYALWLYKRIDGGLWMVQGYAEGLGHQPEDSIWRLAIQVGCHLLSFATVTPGWGTPDQVKYVARVGRDIIVNAWQKNREWFDQSDLACLFSQLGQPET